MKETRILMDMPVIVEIRDESADKGLINEIYEFFQYVDDTFSVFKESSEISRINRGEVKRENSSPDMKTIFRLAEETKRQTDGFFNIQRPDGTLDPSGIVKGWAIWQASKLLDAAGIRDSYVEAGGDIQLRRKSDSEPWAIGIRNPFNVNENVKILSLRNEGIATSGTYIRGQHIYNPHQPKKTLEEIVSLTVIGPNVYEADRFATAAFAMGKEGIHFIEKQEGLEGYAIDPKGIATLTTGFNRYMKS
jgi:thiamine biosynthesis lipoprotein